jgi:hypothetical protein
MIENSSAAADNRKFGGRLKSKCSFFAKLPLLLLIALSPEVLHAEVIYVHTQYASDFVGGVMARSGLVGAELWDKKDRCLRKSQVAKNYIDTELFTSCLLGTPAKPKIPSSSKPKHQPKATTKTQDSGTLTDTANVDPVWADDTRKRIAKKSDDTAELPEMESNAPYTDRNCVLFKPAPNRGAIDWDWVNVTNRCPYPIQVIACYFDVGEEQNCLPGGKGSWATVHIEIGQTKTSIATSRRLPWQVRGIVCNMTPKPNNRLLCVLPKSYSR